MGRLESTLVFYEEYKDHYQYKGQEVDDQGRKIVDGVYILQEMLDYDPPEKMKLILEWT